MQTSTRSKPFSVVFDEVHVQPNEEFWDALTLGSGARKDPQIVGDHYSRV
jgi:hypothetical protein